MTEKQLKYIINLCPQTVLEYDGIYIKPSAMKESMLKLPNDIAQSFIQYGKKWKEWCSYDDELIRMEIFEKNGAFYDQEDWDNVYEAKEKAFKEMQELKDVIIKQLKDGKFEMRFDERK